MRHELGGVQGARRAKRAAGEDVAEGTRDRPDLASVLVLRLGGGLLDGDGSRLVDRALPHLLHEVREAEVVPELRVVLHVRLPLHGVDGAVARSDRAGGRLLLAHPHLVPPVRALHVRAVRALEAKLPADVADLLVGEVADELAQRVRLPLAVRVGEREDVARRLAHRAVLGRDLALARALQEEDARILGRQLTDDRVGEIRRAIGRDHDLEALGRVVERECVREPPANHGFLVVRRHDQRDGRGLLGLAHGARAHPREHAHRERISGMRPGEGAERPPERRARDHAASISRTRARYRSMATIRSASSSTYARPRRPISSRS